jgi:hypothetical protein
MVAGTLNEDYGGLQYGYNNDIDEAERYQAILAILRAAGNDKDGARKVLSMLGLHTFPEWRPIRDVFTIGSIYELCDGTHVKIQRSKSGQICAHTRSTKKQWKQDPDAMERLIKEHHGELLKD